MAPDADPYRTLGLERGATLDDVKKAYRRLAKANHPDAAGEAALPRFLAIQAAYDQIAGPDGGNRGSNGRGPGGAARRALGCRSGPRRRHASRLRRPAASTAGPDSRTATAAGATPGRTRGARSGARARPPGPSGPPAEEGDAWFHVIRRRRDRVVRPGLGRRVVVRHHLRNVLDAESQGIRGSTEARTGVPGTGPTGGRSAPRC